MRNRFTDNLLSTNPINEHETAKHPFSRLLRSQSRWKETHEGHRAERRGIGKHEFHQESAGISLISSRTRLYRARWMNRRHFSVDGHRAFLKTFLSCDRFRPLEEDKGGDEAGQKRVAIS